MENVSMKSHQKQPFAIIGISSVAVAIRTAAQRFAMLNLLHSVLAMLVLGVVCAIAGIIYEYQHEIELLRVGGMQALANYHAYLQSGPIDSAFECVMLAFKWRMPSVGSNLQVLGLFIAFVGAPALVVLLAVMRKITDVAPKNYMGFASWYRSLYPT
jgi:hypothetical protein